MSNDPFRSPQDRAQFATTRWSIVVKAGRDSSADAQEALESLCQTYWYPLYAYVRRKGKTADDAADLTQAFFTQLLEKNSLQSADQEVGRFRTFLLTLFQRFMANEYHRERAQKRGGDRRKLSLDFESAEDRYRFEPVENWTPEKIYQRRWALTLLQQVMELLADEHRKQDKEELFQHCQAFMTGSAEGQTYADPAQALGMTESAVRVAVYRMRQRYQELLKQQVAQTMEEGLDVDEELAELRQALRQ